MSDKSAFLKQIPIWPATLAAALSVSLLSTFGSILLFWAVPAQGWYEDGPFTPTISQLWSFIWNSQLQFVRDYGWLYYFSHIYDALSYTRSQLLAVGLYFNIVWRLCALTGGTLCVGAYIFASQYRLTEPRNRLIHVSGREPISGKQATRLFSRLERARSVQKTSGISIAPRAVQSTNSETEHCLLVGTSGAGKTVIAKYWLQQIIDRKERLLIHDTKGDFTASLPVQDFILLAPHDQRSAVWNIAADCVDLAAARELAAAVIPATHEPMWSNSSRTILTGLIRSLQIKDEDWGWASLRDVIFMDPHDQRTLLETYYPEAARFVEVDEHNGQLNRTSFGYMVGLWAAAGEVISPLAEAWKDADPDRLFSLTEWISDTGTDHRPIILQRAAQFPQLSRAWMQAAIGLLSNHAASAALPDSFERRIWLLLDEFAQIGKIEAFTQLLEIGRSKGICCVVGLQDFEQISKEYDDATLKTWLNLFSTKIICRMNSGPSSQFAAKEVIGYRRVTFRETSQTRNVGNQSFFWHNSDTRSPVSTSEQSRTEEVLVFDPSELERDLGPHVHSGKLAIHAILLKHGRAYFMRWPLTNWSNIRPSTVTARWLKEQ